MASSGDAFEGDSIAEECSGLLAALSKQIGEARGLELDKGLMEKLIDCLVAMCESLLGSCRLLLEAARCCLPWAGADHQGVVSTLECALDLSLCYDEFAKAKGSSEQFDKAMGLDRACMAFEKAGASLDLGDASKIQSATELFDKAKQAVDSFKAQAVDKAMDDLAQLTRDTQNPTWSDELAKTATIKEVQAAWQKAALNLEDIGNQEEGLTKASHCVALPPAAQRAQSKQVYEYRLGCSWFRFQGEIADSGFQFCPYSVSCC